MGLLLPTCCLRPSRDHIHLPRTTMASRSRVGELAEFCARTKAPPPRYEILEVPQELPLDVQGTGGPRFVCNVFLRPPPPPPAATTMAAAAAAEAAAGGLPPEQQLEPMAFSGEGRSKKAAKEAAAAEALGEWMSAACMHVAMSDHIPWASKQVRRP